MVATNPSQSLSILDQTDMVRSIARRIARRYPSAFDVEDLTQIGMMSLMATADRIESGPSGNTLAYTRIRVQGAMVDALRKSDFVPRSVRTRARRLADTRRTLHTELGRAPTQTELAKAWSTTPKQFEQMERGTQVMTLVPLSCGPCDDDRSNEPVRTDDTPYESAAKRDLLKTVSTAIATLPEREGLVVKMYYYEELSLKEIGGVLGVTESRVSQLLTRAKGRLAEVLSGLMAEAV